MRGRDLLWLGGGLAVGVALGVAWPRLRREFGPIMAEAMARGSEFAAEMSTVVVEKMQQAQQQAGATSAAPPHTTRAAS